MDDIDDDMLPADGFRAVLKASYKSETLNPDEITSYEWFHYRWKRSPECIPVDVAAAEIAIKKYCGLCRSGDIRLIGSQVYPPRPMPTIQSPRGCSHCVEPKGAGPAKHEIEVR
jgi:hypothetical protein